MKKVLAIGLLLCLLFVGCKNTQTSDDNAGQTELTMEERALQAAEEYWNIEDGEKDTSTGAVHHIMVLKTPVAGDFTYIMALSRELDGSYRTVGVISIDAGTFEVTKMS